MKRLILVLIVYCVLLLLVASMAHAVSEDWVYDFTLVTSSHGGESPLDVSATFSWDSSADQITVSNYSDNDLAAFDPFIGTYNVLSSVYYTGTGNNLMAQYPTAANASGWGIGTQVNWFDDPGNWVRGSLSSSIIPELPPGVSQIMILGLGFSALWVKRFMM